MAQFKTTPVGSSTTAPLSAAASTASSDLRVWGVLPAAQVTLTICHRGLYAVSRLDEPIGNGAEAKLLACWKLVTA